MKKRAQRSMKLGTYGTMCSMTISEETLHLILERDMSIKHTMSFSIFNNKQH